VYTLTYNKRNDPNVSLRVYDIDTQQQLTHWRTQTANVEYSRHQSCNSSHGELSLAPPIRHLKAHRSSHAEWK